jgi:hypothetical protein
LPVAQLFSRHPRMSKDLDEIRRIQKESKALTSKIVGRLSSST